MTKLFPVILILASIGLFYFYIRPTYEEGVLLPQQQIASYDRALDASKTFAQKENALLAQQNAIPAASITRLQTFLPDDVDNIQLILDLSSLAGRTGVTLSNFSIQDSANNSTSSPTTALAAPAAPPVSGTQVPPLGSAGLVNSLSLTVTVSGPYDAFRTFLAATEQSLRLMDITNLTVSANNSTAGSGYTYGITFLVYWLQ